MKRSYFTTCIIFLFFLASLLIFYRLDSPLLWEDEAEVAVIARNITKYGIPRTWDGDFFITQENGQDSKQIGNAFVWSWNTWLPYYATALSFFTFGESTFSARLPFALSGLLIVYVYFLIAKKVTSNPIAQVFILLCLVFNPLFYLFIRQSRYYAFTILFTLSAFYFFFQYQAVQKLRYAFLLVFSLFLNFHSNFVLSFSATLPIIISPFTTLLTSLFKRKIGRRDILAAGFIGLFLIQSFLWVSVFTPASQGNESIGFYRYWGGINRIIEKIYNHINLINSFYFPLGLFLAIFIFIFLFHIIKRKRVQRNSLIIYLILGAISHILVISFFLQFGQKYLLSLIPFFSLFIGYSLSFIYLKTKPLGLILLFLFATTNIPFLVSERILHPRYGLSHFTFRSFLSDYIVSLTIDYKGPVEGIVSFFHTRGIEEAVIYTDYEIDSLRFYFPRFDYINRKLAVVDNKPVTSMPQDYFEKTAFYIPRRSWGELSKVDSCHKEIIYQDFFKHTLSYYDIPWNNLPDITYHKFFLEDSLPRLIIYEKPKTIDALDCFPSSQ